VSGRWWKPFPSREEKDKKEVHLNPEQCPGYRGQFLQRSGRGIA